LVVLVVLWGGLRVKKGGMLLVMMWWKKGVTKMKVFVAQRKCDLSTSNDFEVSVQNHLPTISSCWILGAKGLTLGACH
jgi:hypothetical protein